MTKKEKRMVQKRACSLTNSEGLNQQFISAYTKDGTFNCKNETAKEKNILTFFKEKAHHINVYLRGLSTKDAITKEEY
eukprot:CAMPEP_0170551040 /NCGR_PEP_ID=MMETSP0211-20121228/9052_1 /TAXON_ID=311385 /ORGANISM="Pseudokeronopsis sp., Strain OXSARD2" /LENGTH=77 /DNA_ID=CAMNT_0010857939 /DNA_START=87 /DNA_END=320 /DNA_ORIENTATION=+